MGYSDQQLAVINSDAKRLAVLAAAGAGKSHTMVGKVKRFLDEGVPARNIAVITFTNEATDSMIEKLEKMGCDTDGITTKTLHSFCYNLIKLIYNFGGKSNMPKIIQSPDMFMGQFWKLVNNVYDKKEEGKYGSYMPHRSWANYYENINYWNLQKYTPEQLIKETFDCTASEFKKVMMLRKYGLSREAWSLLWYLEYEEWKRSTRQVDFNDLLLVAIRELEKASPKVTNFIKNKYRVIIIDEMQDTNALVVDVLKLITSPETTVIMVGDIRQSIYSFINASPKTIMGYVDYDNFEKLSLQYNYRSSVEIVENGNYFMSHYPSFNLGGDTIPTKPKNGFPVVSFVSEDELVEIQNVAERVEGLISEGYKHKDICIMYRTNAQAMMILDWCIRKGLPFNIKKDSSSIFDKSEMKDILAYLKIINETDRTKLEDWKRIANKPSRFISNKALEDATGLDSKDIGFGTELLNKYHSDTKLRDFCEQMSVHIRHCKKIPFAQQIDYILLNIGYERWWNDSDAKDRFFDLRIYSNALKQLACENQTYRGLIKHINDVRKALKERNSADGITFTTIHSSKGLEWPVCIVLGVCERLYPFYRAVDQEGQAGLEEEARLFYVASTRPIERLYYSEIHGKYGTHNAFPSTFVKQTQRQIIENGEYAYGQESEDDQNYRRNFFGNLMREIEGTSTQGETEVKN